MTHEKGALSLRTTLLATGDFVIAKQVRFQRTNTHPRALLGCADLAGTLFRYATVWARGRLHVQRPLLRQKDHVQLTSFCQQPWQTQTEQREERTV